MKPLRKRLEDARKNTGLSWDVIERDYILSWILAGIGANEKLHSKIIFKGGTALKKCYFGDYRFSEDLDFTAKEDAPRKDALEKEIQKSCKLATELVQKSSPLELKAERYREKEPHPGEQEAFIIRGKFPWQREFLVKAMIEITVDEPVKIEPRLKKIIHEYGEEINQKIFVYSLEEIISEKMRTLLQHLQKIKKRGWSRSCARDYYDLWKIFEFYSDYLNFKILPELFLEKCRIREVTFNGPEDFFNKTLIDYVAKTWKQWLGPLVPDLPQFRPLTEYLKNKFYVHIKDINNALYEEVVNRKGYFSRRPDHTRWIYLGLGIGLFVLGSCLGFLIWPLALLIHGAIVLAFAWIMPKKTKTGVLALEKAKGFKLFLSKTETERMKLVDHPKWFDKYLPYAMIYGVEKQWAKKFESIYREPPNWYHGYAAGAFSSTVFASDFSRGMSSSVSRTLASSPSSSGGSGFGGGGFSGGGGGGGGSSAG